MHLIATMNAIAIGCNVLVLIGVCLPHIVTVINVSHYIHTS